MRADSVQPTASPVVFEIEAVVPDLIAEESPTPAPPPAAANLNHPVALALTIRTISDTANALTDGVRDAVVQPAAAR